MSRPTTRRLRQDKTARRQGKRLDKMHRLLKVLTQYGDGAISQLEAEQAIETLYGKHIKLK